MGGLVTGQACEPASVTEARDILGRNGGVVSFQFPVTDTTYLMSDLLAGNVDTLTLASGGLEVRVQADTLSVVGFGDQLRTAEVTTSVGFPTPVFGAPGDTQDTVRFATDQGSSVLSASIQSGFVVRTLTNNTGCTGSAGATVVDSAGTSVVTFPTINVSNGAVLIDSLPVGGVVMAGFVDIGATGSIVGACIPNVNGKVSSAITVRPLVLASVTLDNVSETINVEQSVELDRAQLSLDDLEDAVLDATLNDATIDIVVLNTADIPVVLTNFFIVAVQVDGLGNLARDGGGNLIFETDGNGARLEAAVADPGLSTLTLGRQVSTNVSVQAAAVVDRMLDLLIQDQGVALVAIGDATAGDGSGSTINSTDDVEVQFDVAIGLDFTLSATGVTLDRNQSAGGLELDSADIADISSRLITAALQAEVENSTPFEMEIQVALAPGRLADSVDVFAEPGAVILAPVTVSAPVTNAVGIPTAVATDSISIGISGAQSEVVLGVDFTAGIRFRLLPRSGGGSRGAFLPDAAVKLDASVLLEVRRGTGS
jgi:hypothetical protein